MLQHSMREAQRAAAAQRAAEAQSAALAEAGHAAMTECYILVQVELTPLETRRGVCAVRNVPCSAITAAVRCNAVRVLELMLGFNAALPASCMYEGADRASFEGLRPGWAAALVAALQEDNAPLADWLLQRCWAVWATQVRDGWRFGGEDDEGGGGASEEEDEDMAGARRTNADSALTRMQTMPVAGA